MALAPFLVGLLGIVAVVRALILGSASSDGDTITRKDHPMFYWFFVSAGCVLVAFMFYTAWRGG
jgi:hypothetical protein